MLYFSGSGLSPVTTSVLAEMQQERCHSYTIKHLWTNSLSRAEIDLMTKLSDFPLEEIILNTFLHATHCINLSRVICSAVLLLVCNKAQSDYIAWMQSSPHVYYPQTFYPVLCGSVIWRHRGLYSLFS